MKISNAYPYPVLHEENNDYENSSFNVDIDIQKAFGELSIKVKFQLDNEDMKSLIDSEDAVYMVHIECPQTSFRKAYRTFQDSDEIVLPTKNLTGKVDIHVFIIAHRDIPHYKNRLLNAWYQDAEIHLEKGNFLAIGKAIEVTLHEEDTELMDLPSIVSIHRDQKNDFMEVDMHAHNIIISLPANEYDQYASYANTMLKNTILSLVILPSLTQVFSQVNENRADLEEYTWFQVMDKIFKENNHRFEDVGTESLSALKAAQLVLQKPIKASFTEVEKLNTVEDEA